MRTLIRWHLFLFLMVTGAARPAASQAVEIRQVSVGLNGDKVTIDVNLTESVVPTVIIARNPDRLVLQLPNTDAPEWRKKRTSRTENQAAPPIARVVVDLNTVHPYQLAMNGHTITLTVLPISLPSPLPGKPTSTSGLIARFWRRQPNAALSSSRTGPDGAPLVVAAQQQPTKNLRTKFMVKYVAEGAAYLNGGRGSGLAPGMKLYVRDPNLSIRGTTAQDSPVAQLQVISTAQNSAVTEIYGAKRAIKTGDWAYLSAEDVDRIVAERAATANGKRPPASAFVQHDSPESETQGIRSRSLSPEESRIRARIGFDYSGIRSSGSTSGRSSQRGMSVQADMMNILGTHWNLQGYWRGRLTTHSQALDSTIQDYLDKTYTLQLFYDNPDSKWVAGIGRLYLPWAISLDTIDGGYIGRKVGKRFTAGVFAGSTPNPTSWHYSPDQRIAGSFVNAEGAPTTGFTTLARQAWH
jgi:hypothetical protein